MDLARDADLPVIIHIRDKDGRWDAYDDVANMLASRQADGRGRGG